MSALATLLSGPLAHAIGWALVHLLWQGALVAAILAAALALMQRRSANARYLAACGALVLLIVLGVATAVKVYEPAAETISAPSLGDDALQPVLQQADIGNAAPSGLTWADVVAFANAHLSQFVLAWMVGVLLLSARLACGWIRAHRIATRSAADATAEWQRIAARLAGALRVRGAIRLLESAAVEVPTVIGWLRPVVLLPVATLSGLSTEQMEMVLAHELAHVRRHDFFVNLIQAVVETLLFYHPAVWWIAGRIRTEREHCCDDMAVAVCGNPLLYARALTRLEELRVDPAHAVVAANGGSLLTRIRRLAGGRAEAPNGPSRWAAGAALLTVLAALLVSPSLPLPANAQELPNVPPKASAVPAPPATPAPTPKEAKCSLDVVANADDDSDVNVDVNVDTDQDVVMPAPAAAPVPMAGFAPMALPHGIRVAVDAPAIAAAVSGGVIGGIQGGIEGGIEGGIHTHVRRTKIGANGKFSVDDLIALRSAGVTPAYIDEMRGAGLGELSLDDIAALRMQGVTAKYLASMRNAGLKVDSAEEAVSLKAIGVTPDYIDSMRAAGYTGLSQKELLELRAVGVTPGYVKQLTDIGYRNLSAKELTSLRAMGVTPEFVKSLADAGYTNLSVKDLTRLAAVGVNADFIRDLAKYRTK